MFKIATWNVNSIKVRLPHVLDWLKKHKPDVLALQETKMTDELFPKAAIEKSGYHVAYSGQKTYNGVAIISRQPIKDIVTDLPKLDDPQRRLLGATINKARILNVYVPNGESVDSTKYQYKLDWLKKLRDYVKQQLNTYSQCIILGDFNIAPEDRDVYDPAAWEDHVLVSEAERKALREILKLGFCDTFRLFDQTSGGFSWWDYRHFAFRRNLGLRLDLILANKTLADKCKRCTVDKTPRSLERPSDHTPVVAEFE